MTKASDGGARGAKQWLVLVLCLLGPLAIGFLSGITTVEGVRTWYQGIAKPSFTPPDAVFGPVWTALYLAMGLAAFLVWRSGPDRAVVRTALVWFCVQLVANGLWSVLFFGLRNPGLALAEILLLLGLIVVTTRLFWSRSRLAGALMVPYLAWVAFATALNFSIWRLNA